MSRANRNQLEIQLNLFFFELLRAQAFGLISPIYEVTFVPTGLYYAYLRNSGVPFEVPKSDKPLAIDVQKEFLRAFENPKTLLLAKPISSIFALKNFEDIRECHCIDTLARRDNGSDVRRLFASTTLLQAQLLTQCGIPVRIAVLGAGYLLQTVALMATLSRGGVKNFSIDLIERDYSDLRYFEEHKMLIDNFLKLISNVLGFNVSKYFCPPTSDCTAKLNKIVRDFSTSSSAAGVAQTSSTVRINFFDELSAYTDVVRNGDHLPPTIVSEIDFVENCNADQNAAIRDLRSNLPNGTFWTRANKREGNVVIKSKDGLHSIVTGVDLTAEVIHRDGTQMMCNRFFERNWLV